MLCTKLSKALDNAVAELALISGQKPLVTRAKNQSLLTDFVKVCLSGLKLLYIGERMYEFFDK